MAHATVRAFRAAAAFKVQCSLRFGRSRLSGQGRLSLTKSGLPARDERSRELVISPSRISTTFAGTPRPSSDGRASKGGGSSSRVDGGRSWPRLSAAGALARFHAFFNLDDTHAIEGHHDEVFPLPFLMLPRPLLIPCLQPFICLGLTVFRVMDFAVPLAATLNHSGAVTLLRIEDVPPIAGPSVCFAHMVLSHSLLHSFPTIKMQSPTINATSQRAVIGFGEHSEKERGAGGAHGRCALEPPRRS